MPITMIPSFLLYCFVAGITPGPANLCSLSAAMRYGKRVAFRQWRGLFTGFFIDSMAAVLINRLLGSVLNQYVGILSWVGAAYILWLAWHMLRSSSGEAENDVTYPCFRTGLLVQLTNVKVIIFCITALSSFVLPYTDSWLVLFLTGAFLPFTGPFLNLVWLFAGASLQKLFAGHHRAVDTVMAISLALCACSLVWH